MDRVWSISASAWNGFSHETLLLCERKRVREKERKKERKRLRYFLSEIFSIWPLGKCSHLSSLLDSEFILRWNLKAAHHLKKETVIRNWTTSSPRNIFQHFKHRFWVTLAEVRFFKWANPGLFLVYFRSFLITISIIQIERSIDGVLGIQTQGRRMVGADETTELWRPPRYDFVAIALWVVYVNVIYKF